MFLSMKFMSPTLYAIRETSLYLDSHIGFPYWICQTKTENPDF